ECNARLTKRPHKGGVLFGRGHRESSEYGLVPVGDAEATNHRVLSAQKRSTRQPHPPLMTRNRLRARVAANWSPGDAAMVAASRALRAARAHAGDAPLLRVVDHRRRMDGERMGKRCAKASVGCPGGSGRQR